MIKYVTYKRVSTDGQGVSGLGLEAQQRDIDLYLTNYSGQPFEVVSDFVEIESGRKSDRGELTKAIKLAKKEKAVLLVAKLDRLSRKVSFIAQLVEDKQLEFKIASMPFADKFQIHIYSALAEQERDFISKRTKDALRMAKERGVKLGAKNPQVAKANEAQKKQADDFAQKLWNGTLKAMFESGYSYSQMMRNLNELGVKSKTGRDFSVQAVKNIVLRMRECN